MKAMVVIFQELQSIQADRKARRFYSLTGLK